MLVAQPKAAVIALALVAAMAMPMRAGSVEVTVRATTSLSLDPTTEGRRVTLEGTLRNNLNQGLADQVVDITLTPIELRAGRHAGRHRTTERSETTGRNGRFRFIEVLADGLWSVRAEFAGGPFLDGAVVEERLEIGREQLNLALHAPVASPYWSSVPIRVVAASPGASTDGLPLRLRIGGERANVVLVTDSAGEAGARIEPPQRSGPVVLEVAFSGDNRFEPTSVRQTIQLYDRAELIVDARVEPLREATFLAVAGQLVTDGGPIEGASVSLHIDGRPTSRSASTDAEGRFQLVEVIDDLPTGEPLTVSATYDPFGTPEPDLRVSASADFVVEEVPFAETRNWAGVVAVVLLGGLLSGLAIGRLFKALSRRKARNTVPPLPGRAAPEGMVELSPRRPGRAVSETRINGMVRDADTTKPIDGGELTVERSGDEPRVFPIATNGSFSTEPLPLGRYRLSFSASGYVATRLDVTIPHRGQLHDIEVFICSVRSWVRYLYQRMTHVVSLDDEGKASWGRATPRQLERLLVRTYRAMFDELDREDSGFNAFQKAIANVLEAPNAVSSDRILRALTLLVEEVYYSERLYTETMVELCRSLVVGVQEIAGQLSGA